MIKIGDEVEIVRPIINEDDNPMPFVATMDLIGRTGLVTDIPSDGGGEIIEVEVNYGGVEAIKKTLLWAHEVKLIKNL